MLFDFVKYLDATGGDIDDPTNDTKFYGLDSVSMLSFSDYKSDPIHVHPDILNKVVNTMIKHYKRICNKPLYRGISDAELKGILE
jgi:hypothetical protein